MTPFEARLSEMKADAEICNEKMRSKNGHYLNFNRQVDENSNLAETAKKRRAQVKKMVEEGFPDTAIAALLGASRVTIRQDKFVLRKRGELK